MKYIILFISYILQCYATKTLSYSNILKQTIILNNNVPCLYYNETNLNTHTTFSMEHILPRCFLHKCHYHDMHNIVKTLKKINIQRSNYKFVNDKINYDNWKEIQYHNFVNHKNGLFIPNESSRGIISRSLLYMAYEYDYNLSKIIDKDTLIDWYYKHPPCHKEIYHNKIINDIQKKDNIFVSKYNKKTKHIANFLDKI